MFALNELKDWVGIAAAIFAIFVAIKGLIEFRNSLAERRRERRWRQASTAKQLVDDIRANYLAAAALKMLDWEGAEYTRPDGDLSKPVFHTDRRKQLRVTNVYFDDEDEPDAIFIRDCFDRLMEDVSLIENYIAIDLIRFTDVEPFFRYYVKLASGPDEAKCLKKFALKYGYRACLDFHARFDRARRPAASATGASG